MLIGACNYICLRYLPSVLMGGNPTYYQNASFLLDGSPELVRQPIDEQGCHNVFKQAYEASEAGALHAAWIRKTASLSLSHDEILFYSANRDGRKWSPPLELYSVEDTEVQNHLHDLSLATAGDAAMVLWQDVNKGIFFSEIREGRRSETLKLSEFKKEDVALGEPLPVASTIKLTSDHLGNVYALWTRNTGKSYSLHLKTRIGSQWTPEITVSQGRGYLKLPDMKVDREGHVHIVYVRPSDPARPDGQYGCFYVKLEPQGKTDQSGKD